jgi:hypothetical protein
MARDRDRAARSSRKSYWMAHIRACDRSGLSIAEYCRRQGLSYHAFRYWKKKMGHGATVPGISLVEIGKVLGNGTSMSGAFSLRLRIDGKYSIEVGDAFNPSTLARLVSVVEGL